MSAKTEAHDLDCVLETAKEWDFVRPEQIVVVGGSLGGLVATMVAHERKDELAGLALLYPAYQLPERLRNTFPNRQNIPDAFTFANSYQLGRPFVDDIYELYPYQLMQDFTKDVLILHGDRDKAVPLHFAEEAATTFPHAELHVLHGTGHFFPEPEKQAEAISQLLNYLCKMRMLPAETAI